MAYVDQNGLVLIDEIEAADDIKKLKNALVTLEETLEIVNQIAGINSSFSGDTANAIEVSSAEFINRINQQKTQIENEIKVITDLIAKYQVIDNKMKNQINSALS